MSTFSPVISSKRFELPGKTISKTETRFTLQESDLRAKDTSHFGARRKTSAIVNSTEPLEARVRELFLSKKGKYDRVKTLQMLKDAFVNETLPDDDILLKWASPHGARKDKGQTKVRNLSQTVEEAAAQFFKAKKEAFDFIETPQKIKEAYRRDREIRQTPNALIALYALPSKALEADWRKFLRRYKALRSSFIQTIGPNRQVGFWNEIKKGSPPKTVAKKHKISLAQAKYLIEGWMKSQIKQKPISRRRSV